MLLRDSWTGGCIPFPPFPTQSISLQSPADQQSALHPPFTMFNNAQNFYIDQMYAVDGQTKGNEFHRLVQAACLGAGHKSAERGDAPKCHPETRQAVLNDIMSWVNSDNKKESIMWLSGPAGAGKTSIAQTVCDSCDDEKKLLASFFFSRTATGTGRDDGNRLVPTLAYQLAVAIPETKERIVRQLENDPGILDKSMEVLMQKLVLEPLSEVYRKQGATTTRTNTQTSVKKFSVRKYLTRFLQRGTPAVPYVVVIDGLDECNDSNMQARIINMISTTMFNRKDSILRFLIVSRPELEIRRVFDSLAVSGGVARIFLNDHYKPDKDIRVFLRSEFESLRCNHPLKSLGWQESTWPQLQDIEWLVKKSSGQFIYASTIMKYLKSPRRDPRVALRSIMSEIDAEQSGSMFKESPYSSLDNLYRNILSAAVSNLQGRDDSFIPIFQILLYALGIGGQLLRTIYNMASFISKTTSEVQLLLVDLHSIMLIPESIHDGVRFYHASFSDFLKTSTRSMEEFFVDETEAYTALAQYCFTGLSCYLDYPNAYNNRASHPDTPDYDWPDVALYSRHNYFYHIKASGYNKKLLRELQFSPALSKIVKYVVHTDDLHAQDSFKIFYAMKMFTCFFNFSYDIGNPHFDGPINEEVKDICAVISRVVDDIILSSFPSVSTVEILEALYYLFVSPFREELGGSFCDYWLAMLLTLPQRGKHLYLDSEKSLHLFTFLCDPAHSEYVNVGVFRFFLDKIAPSDELDLESLRAMAKKLINTSMHMDERREALGHLESFIQKHVAWRNNMTPNRTLIISSEGKETTNERLPV